MTAVAPTRAAEPRATSQPPYRAGDRVQILYMSERGTILADVVVTAVSGRGDGSYGVNAVLSDARANFRLVPAARATPTAETARTIRPAAARGPGHVIHGVDHTNPTE